MDPMSQQTQPMSQYDIDENSTPSDPWCGDPLDFCPIDSWLSALFIIAAGYGVKKAREARRIQEIN